MEIFCHHLYEFEKGLRDLILYTGKKENKELIESKLKNRNIAYYIVDVNEYKINVFFGDKYALEVLKIFGDKPLNKLSDEEDYILGILLGYDRMKQCKRYLKRKKGVISEPLVG